MAEVVEPKYWSRSRVFGTRSIHSVTKLLPVQRIYAACAVLWTWILASSLRWLKERDFGFSRFRTEQRVEFEHQKESGKMADQAKYPTGTRARGFRVLRSIIY